MIGNSEFWGSGQLLIMDDSVRKSCWGVTVWTVAIFSALMMLGFLCSNAETVAIAAN